MCMVCSILCSTLYWDISYFYHTNVSIECHIYAMFNGRPENFSALALIIFTSSYIFRLYKTEQPNGEITAAAVTDIRFKNVVNSHY